MIANNINPTDNTYIILASLNIDFKLLNNIALNFISNVERRTILNSNPSIDINDNTTRNNMVKKNMNIIEYKINNFIKEFMDSTSVLLNNSSKIKKLKIEKSLKVEDITRSSQLKYIFGLINKPILQSHQLNYQTLQGIINLGIIFHFYTINSS